MYNFFKTQYAGKSSEEKKPQPEQKTKQMKGNLGLFKNICTSAVVGEILYHFSQLRNGESYPLVVYIQPQSNNILKFPGFQEIESYLRK